MPLKSVSFLLPCLVENFVLHNKHSNQMRIPTEGTECNLKINRNCKLQKYRPLVISTFPRYQNANSIIISMHVLSVIENPVIL